MIMMDDNQSSCDWLTLYDSFHISIIMLECLWDLKKSSRGKVPRSMYVCVVVLPT